MLRFGGRDDGCSDVGPDERFARGPILLLHSML
jgi:hypothetical protein